MCVYRYVYAYACMYAMFRTHFQQTHRPNTWARNILPVGSRIAMMIVCSIILWRHYKCFCLKEAAKWCILFGAGLWPFLRHWQVWTSVNKSHLSYNSPNQYMHAMLAQDLLFAYQGKYLYLLICFLVCQLLASKPLRRPVFYRWDATRRPAVLAVLFPQLWWYTANTHARKHMQQKHYVNV